MPGHGSRGARRLPGGPRATLGANLGLLYLNLGPPDRSRVPSDVPEASRVDFGAISDPSGRPWKPKNIVKYDVFAAFHVAPQRTSRSSKSALGGSQKDPQEANTASERPWRPSWAQLAQKSRPEAFQRPFWTPPRAGFPPSGGRFSDSFLLSESIAKAVQWAQLAQAYAQHRFTSLCNFYSSFID